MYYTTGFDKDEIIDICTRVACADVPEEQKKWPPCPGLFDSVVAALSYMRHNRVQAELAESLGVSQPTISRAISVIAPILAECMREFAPTADDLDPDAQYIVEGTLLPCWSWKDRPELYSGKHKTTGVNVQLACSIYGRLSWVSDPITGNHHDNYCLGDSGVLLTLDPGNWMGDKGYIGNKMITPIRKRPRGRRPRGRGRNREVPKIGKLPKPTVVAWLANQLARQYPGELRPLLELGEALRQATADLDAGQLRELSRQQHQVVSALTVRARELASAAGQAVSGSTVRGLEDTLHAALADEQAAQLFTQGRLAAGLSRTGFPGIDISASAAAAAEARFRPSCTRA
jgi:hypothetical protein